MQARRAGRDAGPGVGAAGSAGARADGRHGARRHGSRRPPGQNSEKEEGPAEEAPEENRPSDLEPLASYPNRAAARCRSSRSTATSGCAATSCTTSSWGSATRTSPAGRRPGHDDYGLPPFPVPLDCPAPAHGQRRSSPRPAPPNPGQNCGQKNIGGANLRLRLQPTLNVTDQVRVHAQIDVLDNTILGSTPDSLAGIQGYNVPPGRVDRRPADLADVAAGRGALGLPVHDPGPARNRPERLHLQHPRQARLGRDRHRVRLDPVRPHALALGPRHVLQRRQLRGLRRRDHRRSRDGADHHLRPPAGAGLGPGRAGDDHPAAVAGAPRSQRLPLRPVAERRRAAADGVDHPDRQPDHVARADRPRRRRRQLRLAGRLSRAGQDRRPADEHRHAGQLALRSPGAGAGPAPGARSTTVPGASPPTCGSSCTTSRSRWRPKGSASSGESSTRARWPSTTSS